MTQEDRELLEYNGWIIESENPLEISKCNGKATNLAAEVVILYLKKTNTIPKPKRVNNTGVPDTFILTGKELQNWYHNGIVPKGFEMFDPLDYECCDIDTGKYDSSKHSMVDYEIALSINDGDEVWIGKGGYYNEGCGHQFNYEIKFKWDNN